MNKYLYTIGASVLVLAMSGLPAATFAEKNGSESQGDANAQIGVQALGVQASTSASVRVGSGDDESVREQQKQDTEVVREQAKQQAEGIREEQKQQFEASSSARIQGGGEVDLELEDDQDIATSSEDLNQKIEVRKRELAQEAASSTPNRQVAVEHANEVRLAVHSLLSSKKLIGGIGPQVSEIAKQMNDSVATTTNAEAKIQSRGFLTRLLFGGDSTSAEVIAQEAAQNQARIDSLTALLGQANISVDVQATLNAQITALKDAQARLQALAQSEQKAWGLFSWRF